MVKCGLLGGAVVAFAIVYGLGTSWSYEPLGTIDVRQTRFTEVFFDMQGVTPVGYTQFAVALGAFAGTLLPKVLPAMALTLAGFVSVRVVVRPPGPVALNDSLSPRTSSSRVLRPSWAFRFGQLGQVEVERGEQPAMPGSVDAFG